MNGIMSDISCEYSKNRRHLEKSCLACVEFSDKYKAPDIYEEKLHVWISSSQNESDDFFEIWKVSGEVECGKENGVLYSLNDKYIFCAVEIKCEEGISTKTKEVYLSCFNLLSDLGYKNIFRMWNFIPNINEDNEEGLEVYKDFCMGRAQAFEDYARVNRLPMPAATGIGAKGGEIVMYLLASKVDHALHIENPRQIPAFTYPRIHGPKSPSFARATYINDNNGSIFVSGTASIIGHETVCIGDVAGQCITAIENIELLIGEKNCLDNGIECGASIRELDQIKVYVRNLCDLPIVKKICSEKFGRSAQIQYLNVDICRSNLLVEIEGMAVNCHSYALTQNHQGSEVEC